MNNKLSIRQIYTEVLSIYETEKETILIRDIDKLKSILKKLKARIKRYPATCEEANREPQSPIPATEVLSPELAQKLNIAESNLDEATLKTLHTVSKDLVKKIEERIACLESLFGSSEQREM